MKALLSLTTLTAALPLLLHADSDGNHTSSRRAKKPSTPPAPKAADAKVDQGPFVTGDFLYWIASEDGLEYAVSGLSNSGSTTAVSQGKVREPEFEWEPALRLGIGYTLPKSNWDAGISWTRFRTEARNETTAPQPILLSNRLFPMLDLPTASFGVSGVGTPLDAASAKLQIEYDTLDFLLGREFRVNEYFSVRPSAGVRGAWIDQHYRLNYSAKTLDPGDPLHKVKLDNDFRGVGIRTALDANWECHRLVSIYAKAGMTLFHGSFDIRQTYTNAVAGTVYGVLHTKEFLRVVPEFDTSLGLRVQLGPCGVLKRCEITAGYEFTLYPHQNQTLYFTDDTRVGLGMRQRGDLNLQGFTFGTALYF